MPGTRVTPEQLIQLPEIEKTLHKQNTSYFTLSSSLIDGPKEIYLNGTKEEEGSYLWLKSQITEELKYADHIFKFNDDKKKISCYSPIYTISSDDVLVAAINTALDNCINHDVIGKINGEDNLGGALILSTESDANISRSSSFDEGDNTTKQQIALNKKPTITSFPDLLENNFVIGETHSDISPKRFLQENMQSLQEQGYKTLFMEHLFYDSAIQQSLDNYHNSPKETEMPRDLACYLEFLGNGQSSQNHRSYNTEFNFKEVVKSAKEAGIRVVAIDSKEAYSDKDEERYESLNYLARHIINQEAPEDGKWLALVGEAHIGTKDGVLGISELTSAPSVHIYDNPIKTEKAKVEFGTKSRNVAGHQIQSDVRISCPLKKTLKIEDIEQPRNSIENSRNGSSQLAQGGCCTIM